MGGERGGIATNVRLALSSTGMLGTGTQPTPATWLAQRTLIRAPAHQSGTQTSRNRSEPPRLADHSCVVFAYDAAYINIQQTVLVALVPN